MTKVIEPSSTVILVNADQVDKLGVVVLPDFSFAPHIFALYASLIATFRSRAALQLEILAVCRQ